MTGSLPTQFVTAAVARWESTGLSPSEVRWLRSVSVSIDDLPTGVLAVTDGTRITLDTTAAGHGWFVDPTPSDDAEFRVVAGTTELASPPGTSSSVRLDLFTVLLHELGHVLGRRDLTDGSRALMASELSAGVRRLPDGVSPQSPQQRIARQSWQNEQNRFDVNMDGVVSPVDALLVINDLNLRGSRLLTDEAEGAMVHCVDVTGDRYVSAIDVLGIFNALDEKVTGPQSAEGEWTETVRPAAKELMPPSRTDFIPSWPQRPFASLLQSEMTQPLTKQPTSDNLDSVAAFVWSVEDATAQPMFDSFERLSSRMIRNGTSEGGDELDTMIEAVADDVAFAWVESRWGQ